MNLRAWLTRQTLLGSAASKYNSCATIKFAMSSSTAPPHRIILCFHIPNQKENQNHCESYSQSPIIESKSPLLLLKMQKILANTSLMRRWNFISPTNGCTLNEILELSGTTWKRGNAGTENMQSLNCLSIAIHTYSSEVKKKRTSSATKHKTPRTTTSFSFPETWENKLNLLEGLCNNTLKSLS